MSFLNLEKYPPSLLYLCATLGITLVALGLVDGRDLAGWRPVVLFGRVALFYYVIHLYVIHALAVAAAVLTGYPWRTLVFLGQANDFPPEMKGKYGFSLRQVYLIWLGIVLLLYPCCRYWNELKGRHRSRWWVSYV